MSKSTPILFRNINVSKPERIMSATGGALLICNSFKRKKQPLKALVGGYLLLRGATGYCPISKAFRTETKPSSVEVVISLTVNKPLDETYQFWRNLSRLPLFMKHLKTVTEVDKTKSVWVAMFPWKIGELQWEAEITAERVNELIAWQSLENSVINNRGSVYFKDAGKFGTEVQVRIYYAAPGGKPGELAAHLVKPAFKEMIKEDIKNFRRYIETGEIPTTDGQPSNS